MKPKFPYSAAPFKNLIALSFCVSAVILCHDSAQAGLTWTGTTNQDWNTATNWGGAFPTGGNTTVNTATGNFPIIAAASAFTPVDIIVGVGVAGRVDHRAGALSTGLDNWMIVGRNAGGNGTFNLADTSVTGQANLTTFGPGTGGITVGGTSTVGGRLILGDTSTSVGTLNMNTSGVLKMERDDIGVLLGSGGTSTGNFNLDGGTVTINSLTTTGIAILNGTNGGDGNFRMSGGTVNAVGGIWAGDNAAGSQGLYDLTGGTFTATATGNSATNQAGQHFIGRGLGQGTFNVKNTANVTLNGVTHIGFSNTATVGTSGILAVSGGTFTTNDDVRVGSAQISNTIIANATGTFNVTGGTSTVGSLTVARGNDTGDLVSGAVNVTGGSLTSVNDVVLGFAGNGNLGQLKIDGGTLNVGTTALKWLQVGVYDTSKGQLDLMSGNLKLMSGSFIRFSAGNTVGANVINQTGGTATFYADNGITVGGTGALDMQQGGAAATSNTYNLNGGSLIVPQIISNLTTGTRTFNFNGGTLKPTAATATFINLGTGTGTARANVRNLGAKIDSNGFDITIGQALLHSNIGGDLATDGGLTKSGSGKLTLSAANTYNGPTSVDAGTLELTSTSGSNITVKSGAVITGTGVSSGSLTMEAGSTLSTSTTSPLEVNGVSFASPTTLAFNGIPINGTEYILLKYGAGGVSNLGNLSSPGFRTVITDDPTNSQIKGTVTTGSLNWNTTNGTWALGGTGWSGSFSNYYNGDLVSFNERPAASVVTISGTLTPADITVNNSTNPYTFTGSGSIAGPTALTKYGAGSLTIENANSYSGGTTLNAGILNINNPTAIGTGLLTINGGTIDNTSGAAIVMTANNPQQWDEDFTFTGTNNLDMGIGAVAIGGSGTDRIVTVSGGTLAVGEIRTFSHGLIKQGPGTLVAACDGINYTGIGLGDGSGLAGVLNVAAGTLQMNRSTGASGDFTAAGITGTGTITNGAPIARWFVCNPTSGTVDFAGTLTGGGTGALGFFKNGAGTQILSGTNSYTDPTTIGGGELVISGTNSSAGTDVFLNNGKLTLASSQPLGLASLVRLAGANVSTLELATDTTGTPYNIAMGTGTAAMIIANRATPGAGVNHTISTQGTGGAGLGGGTLNFTSGGNVTSGMGRVTFTQFGMAAGSVQTTTLNPTTANVTLGNVSKVLNNVSQTLGLGGTTTDNLVTGAISNGAPLTGGNNVSVIKTGSGTWTLSGTNTYTGTTAVNEGTLMIAGSNAAATGAVTVEAAATLGGSGNIGGAVSINPGGHQAFAVAATPGAQATRTITGSLTLSGGNVVDLTAAVAPAAGVYTLVTTTGTITGTPTTVNYNGITGVVTVEGGNTLVLKVGYDGWASSNAGGQSPDLDYDNDGVSNGVEYFMNAAPGFTANPTLGAGNSITWTNGGNIPSTDYPARYVVQTSSDLVTWADVLSGDLTTNTNGPGGSLTYTLTGSGSRFVRLKVKP